jgi:hypothetical protein
VKNVARIALVAASAIVYHNALSASFFDDDFQWLVGSWSFEPAQLVAFGSLTHFYRPVVDLYFAVMTPLLGGSPVLFHASSIALHAATVLVVFALAQEIFVETDVIGANLPSSPKASADHRSLGGGGKVGPYSFAAALFFAVQPSDTQAVAWVSAVSETIGTLFGCLSLLWFLRWRMQQGPHLRVLSIAAFALALLTHESSVVFGPVLFLADWFICRARRAHPAGETVWTSTWRTFGPYVVLTIAYLAIDIWINSRNYVVSQGHYTLGLHIVTNALDYIQALYVGRRDWVNYGVIVVGTTALLVTGNARVRFATCWMLLALAPFLSFNWGNSSRYLYQPAIGFSLLLTEAVLTIGTALSRRRAAAGSHFRRAAIVSVLVAIVAVRFGLFAASNVRDFTERSQVYPQYLARFRQIYGNLPANATVTSDPPTTLPHQFVNAAVQWDYRNPTIRVAPYESTDVR